MFILQFGLHKSCAADIYTHKRQVVVQALICQPPPLSPCLAPTNASSYESAHTCIVCYLTWQAPNHDQLASVERGQSDYLKTQALSPLVSILLFQSVIRITMTTIHTLP